MGDADITPTRMRTKKKSTLTKLKERKLRENGSSLSLQSQQDTGSSETSPDHKPNAGTNQSFKIAANGDRIFSTKDPPESPDRQIRPQPKPRRGSRQSSLERQHGLSRQDHEENGGQNSTSRPRLQDLKLVGHDTDSLDSNISNSSFIPKPPLTPRSQNSNPRTPRGFVLGPNKTDKQPSSDNLDWLSVEENDIRKGREKSRENDRQRIQSNLDESVGDQSSPNERLGKWQKEISPKRQIPGQVKIGERLLKRRGSIDSLREELDTKPNGEVSKPPIYNGIHYNSNNSSNRNKVGHTPLSPLSQSDANTSITHSPQSSSKYLKSSQTSEKRNDELRDYGAAEKMRNKHSSVSQRLSSRDTSPSKLTSMTDTPHSPSRSRKVNQHIDTSDALHAVRPPSNPSTSTRLNPISPRPNPPPPLGENVTSHTLRTVYKVDPNVRPGTGSARVGEKSESGGAGSNGDQVSQQSFTSVSVLPVITTKEARSRSYLEGSIGTGTPSLLGAEELDRYFPNRKVNILVGTWNMNEQKDISYPLDDFVLPQSCDYVQDIYAFGTQENDMNKKEWEVKIQETLGPSHVMLHSVSLGSLHLVVFIRRDLIWFCSLPEDDVLSLRAVTMVKTKGAIGISLSLFGTSYLFINCHLTSDRDNDNTRKKNRLGDYFKVIQDMKLPKSSQLLSSAKKTSDITAIFDCVFWFGDLNFRIERKRHAVEGKVSQITEEEFPNFETLLGGDQLLKYMTEGKIFHGFQEGRINFHPTFKFDVNKDTYDSSQKNRVPSYTDRIMFRSKRKNDISCVCYDAVMSIKHSDHKPVFGQFETVVRAGSDNTVYGAGHFDRSVYIEANKRRAAQLPLKKKSNSKVCTIQ